MKTKLQTLTKTLLVAAGLCVGVSAWAYEIPNGMEVKQVLIGTLSAGNVTVETFDEDGATVPSFTNSASFTISDAIPTDQWQSCTSSLSGKVLRLGSRSTHEIDFSSVVTSGKIVFAADFYVGTNQKIIKFIDNDDQVVARFVFPDKNASNGRVYNQQYLYVDVDNEAVFSSTPQISDTWQGTRNREYRITELVIDLDANKITYSGKVMDRRSGSDKWCDDNATITLSKSISIKGMIIDASGVGNNTYYAYYDNMKLYSVDKAAGMYDYAINAVSGGTVIKEMATGIAASGSDFGTYLPEVIYYNNQYYRLDDNDISSYYASFTMGDADVVREISYSLKESVSAFWECENMSYGHNAAQTLTDSETASNGKAVAIWPANSLYDYTKTFEKGVYNISVSSLCHTSGYTDKVKLQYSTDKSEWIDLAELTQSSGVSEVLSKNVLIPTDESYLRILDASGHTPRHYVDYIIVDKLYDITDASKIIGAVDYSTAWKAATTTPVTLKPGDSYRYQFVNYSQAIYNDQNWQLIIANENNDADVLEIRADWYENKYGSTISEHQRGFSSNAANYWDNVPSKMNGATVDMTVTFTTDKKFTMSSTTTAADGETSWTYNYTSDNDNNVDLTGNAAMTVYLTVYLNWLEILSESQTAVGVTTTSAGKGWATLYTDKGLDFSGVDGLTAYTATLSGTTVTLNDVNDIQAETGVVLKSTTTDATTIYSVPVTTTSETPKGSLTGSTTDDLTYSGSDTNSYYMLALNSNDKAQFSKLTSGSITAGKAYLVVAEGLARSLNVVFADETTDISGIQSVTRTDGQVYNLNGQRVAAPQKGLYIINGKKVIVK